MSVINDISVFFKTSQKVTSRVKMLDSPLLSKDKKGEKNIRLIHRE